MNKLYIIGVLFLLFSCQRKTQSKGTNQENSETDATTIYDENYRGQYHFSPEKGWMNDPNGLVYKDSMYHLFYQYYPNATVWGPMHWGHATTKNFKKWEHKPIALYPDDLGFIFSGSAVVDVENTSGFGKDGKAPLVAIFTHHNMKIEKEGGPVYQYQSLAYSLDEGETWTKYEGNPILVDEKNKDFRDPKVFWHKETKSWIMVLVAGDHAKLYRSKNLKKWDNISDFGLEQGAHGGVWECPDLFKLKVKDNDEEKWVMLISIGSGGPNGGSATQYFVGDFDGTTFTSEQKVHRWLDWGTDNYAGVTYNDAPKNERVFIGWMSNWQYALKTPTGNWRSAMTLPRKLGLEKKDNKYYLTSSPLKEFLELKSMADGLSFDLKKGEQETLDMPGVGQSVLQFKMEKKDLKFALTNAAGERATMLFDSASKLFIFDRTQSGNHGFNYEFGNKLHYMPVDDLPDTFEVTIYVDRSSWEVFINDGQFVFTQQLFPSEEWSGVLLENLSGNQNQIKGLKMAAIPSIWSN
ncbi:glycosyl hydrolase family 32 [Croceivirga radicis]|uniref:Glycosyl hydrolase family 32 n=1 Tax=Croceivirga radicis TaxID=1929488 RepID=A0A1V6LQV1_9FLAO|nr:glycoside hydrolase family 32 protein [Croceivirga radicis]OQD42518.1 glycosyl hydrolase family 32 [Croceivirga radicis]